MEQQFDFEVLVKLKQKKRRKIWKRILSAMMCTVVFCTTYMLILPAITKEAETFCGIEEHEHSEACYERVQLCEDHIHSSECFESEPELICTEPAEGGHAHGETCGPVSETELICGIEENEDHTHSDSCYAEVITYSCGLEEIQISHTHSETCYANPKQICNIEVSSEHQHTDDCYRENMICSKEEHAHTLICFSDPSADLESESVWKSIMPELTGIYTEDVVGVAGAQLGYTESIKNYTVDEDNNIKGYSRFGAWYGDPYADWNATFVSFCMYYAGVEEMPLNDNCHDLANEIIAEELFGIPSEYIPKAGDIIFFDFEEDGIIDRTGIVNEIDNTKLVVIEGDIDNSVVKNRYEMHDRCIVGYGMVSELQRPQIEEPAEPTEEPTEPTEEPTEPAEPTEETVLTAPEGVDAWAELVEPDSQVAEEPTATEQIVSEETSVKAARSAASTYGLRRTATTLQNSARAGAPLDLTPYITAVKMYDANGNLLPSGSLVTEGDLIEFKIEYTVTGQQLAVMNGENLTVISDTLTYNLPEIFQVVRSNSGNIINSVGKTVGTFEVSGEDGTITVKFFEEFLEQNAKGIQIQGNVSFASIVTKITESDDEYQDFKFKDGIVLGIEIKEEKEGKGDLEIEKQKTSVSGENIVYEIKVTSAEGTKGSVTVTDQMSKGLTFNGGMEVLKNGYKQNNFVVESSSEDGFTIILPEMKAGDSYTIRYNCKADIDLLDADMTVRNTATVTGKDSEDHDLEDKTTVEHIFEMLDKTGKLNDDGSITWTIIVNRAKADISGWILEDRIGFNNNSVAYTGTVTISDANGNVIARNVNLPYTFPNGSKDTYVITYTTSHEFGDGHTIYNTAILKNGNTEVNDLTGVDIGSPFEKTGEIGEPVQNGNGNYVVPITWTVTIDATVSGISGGLYFDDIMKGYTDPSDDMYMTYDQLMAALDNIEAEIIRVSGEEIGWFSAWEYVPGDAEGQSYSIFQLWSNEDNCQSKKFERFAFSLSDKGIPKGNVLTFTYEAYGVFPNNIISTSKFVNRFNLIGQYEVESRVTYTAGTVKATKYAISYYDPAVPQEWHWGNIDWNGVEGISRYEYEKLKDSYLAWSIELSVPPTFAGKENITLYEDLPEGVSVKKLGLVSRDNVPSKYLMIEDMVPGETYTWDFDLYTAEQYVNWNHRDGQPVSITIKYTESKDLEITFPGTVFEVMGQVATLYNQEEWYSYLNIYTQIDDDFEWTPKAEGSFVYVNNFENRFTIENVYGDVIDIGSQTQRITRDDTENVVRKEAEMDDNNIITYTVLLNEGKRDLIENSGTLKIHDELTYKSTAGKPLRLRLVPGSVKLYEVRVSSDGNYTKLGEVTANYSYNEISETQGGITSWVHTIDLIVPDSKSLLLEYSYKAEGEKKVMHDVLNTCSIEGVGQGFIEGDTNLEVEVKDATAQADTKGVMIYKVDAGSDGIFLEEAKFNIYIWNEEQNKYIIVHHPENGGIDFKTDASGMIVLDDATMDQFAYNTAYYIVEVESPNGYYISPEHYYFYIVNDDLLAYPSCIPNNFEGHALTSGDIIYRQNVSEFTEIRVEKYWKNYNGGNTTVTGDRVSSVTLELWQMLKGDPNSAKLYGTYTMTPDKNGNWNLIIDGLPKATKNADGTKGTDYLYYIEEVGVGGFILESTTNNEGTNSGTIKLFNRELEGYELPETGGIGTQVYTVSGLMLMLIGAVSVVCVNNKRRKNGLHS